MENKVYETHENGKIVEGYLGSYGWEGNKSNLYLYGADLSKAIRKDLKEAGIKGCSVAVKYGNVVRATIKISDDEFASFDCMFSDWIRLIKNLTTKEEIMYHLLDAYGEIRLCFSSQEECDVRRYANNLEDIEEFKEKVIECLKAKYDKFISYMKEGHEHNINHYHLENERWFTNKAIERFSRIYDVINTYRSDHSNSQVDYFDANIYIDLVAKAA